MTFTVASNSFKDSDYLPSDFILSSDFGFGWAGRNRSPHLKWSGAPEGTKSFAVTRYDPRRADWLWLLALAASEYSRQCERTCRGCRQYGRQAPCGGIADTHRFRRAWLRRAVSTPRATIRTAIGSPSSKKTRMTMIEEDEQPAVIREPDEC